MRAIESGRAGRQALRIRCGEFGGATLRIRRRRILRVNRKSGNLLELVEADTLREKECGETPRSIREAFLLCGECFVVRAYNRGDSDRGAGRCGRGVSVRRAAHSFRRDVIAPAEFFRGCKSCGPEGAVRTRGHRGE